MYVCLREMKKTFRLLCGMMKSLYASVMCWGLGPCLSIQCVSEMVEPKENPVAVMNIWRNLIIFPKQ